MPLGSHFAASEKPATALIKHVCGAIRVTQLTFLPPEMFWLWIYHVKEKMIKPGPLFFSAEIFVTIFSLPDAALMIWQWSWKTVAHQVKLHNKKNFLPSLIFFWFVILWLLIQGISEAAFTAQHVVKDEMNKSHLWVIHFDDTNANIQDNKILRWPKTSYLWGMGELEWESDSFFLILDIQSLSVVTNQLFFETSTGFLHCNFHNAVMGIPHAHSTTRWLLLTWQPDLESVLWRLALEGTGNGRWGELHDVCVALTLGQPSVTLHSAVSLHFSTQLLTTPWAPRGSLGEHGQMCACVKNNIRGKVLIIGSCHSLGCSRFQEPTVSLKGLKMKIQGRWQLKSRQLPLCTPTLAVGRAWHRQTSLWCIGHNKGMNSPWELAERPGCWWELLISAVSGRRLFQGPWTWNYLPLRLSNKAISIAWEIRRRCLISNI